jgi:thiamine-monophosphate kinase
VTETVGGLGEFGLIDAIAERLVQGPLVLLGPGDDAAVVSAPDARVVASSDLLVEGSHFRRDWSTGYDIGRKAAAANLADIAAMGARPTSLLAGFATPGDLPAAWALELVDGLRDEAALVDASVVGGDVVKGSLVVLAVTALGDLEGRAPVTRSGAGVGNVVAVCGRLGWAEAGLAVLSRGFRTPRAVADAHRRPQPPYAAGPQAAQAGATAMCDVSDGLIQDLGHVARASGVGIEIDAEALVVDEPLRQVASALGADPLRWVLTGGEDHALAACFPDLSVVPDGWVVVGQVVAGEGIAVPHVELEASGFDHFRS